MVCKTPRFSHVQESQRGYFNLSALMTNTNSRFQCERNFSTTVHAAKIWPFRLVLVLLFACGYAGRGEQHRHGQLPDADLNKISNVTVRSAVGAWQHGDSKLWLSYFTPDAQLFDDGHPRNFQEFSTRAIGNEVFVTIDKISIDGRTIYGHFHTLLLGDFKAAFSFYLNDDKTIYRLDIARVNY